MAPKTSPIKKEEEIQQNPDHRIDQDYPGFPHAPSGKKHITPKTAAEQQAAGVVKKTSKKTYGS
jgi:hypothetical protein